MQLRRHVLLPASLAMAIKYALTAIFVVLLFTPLKRAYIARYAPLSPCDHFARNVPKNSCATAQCYFKRSFTIDAGAPRPGHSITRRIRVELSWTGFMENWLIRRAAVQYENYERWRGLAPIGGSAPIAWAAVQEHLAGEPIQFCTRTQGEAWHPMPIAFALLGNEREQIRTSSRIHVLGFLGNERLSWAPILRNRERCVVV